MAHITGGGITDNLPRVLPEDLAARIDLSSWKVPQVFGTLVELGRLSRDEAYRTFNMGAGMLIVANGESADTIVSHLERSGECAWVAGEIVPGHQKVQYV
jgi:phosphoribosylformylglycinamidine cyclo-ligase